MSTHSVAEARNSLSVLIDRAVAGEQIVITRHGQPIVELRALASKAEPITGAALDWLAQHRVTTGPFREDAGTLVSRMRDGEP